MRTMLSLLTATFLGYVLAGDSAATTWVEWTTEVSTVYSTYTKYVTDTSISVSVSLSVSTVYVPTISTTTVKEYQTVPTTVYQPVPTTIVQNSVSVVTVPTTIVQNSAVTVLQTVPTTIVSAVVSVITTISRNTVTLTASTTCPSSLSGLVTCESRIINPTYTPATPLPSTYLWGCPPGYVCHPDRVNCNFEQNFPAQSYVCRPEQCRPAAQIPDYDAWAAANGAFPNRTDCAFITPIDDYFPINPLFFGLNFRIFNVYGQPTCSATTTCPAASTKTVTVVQAGNTWAPWSGPVATQASSHVTSYVSAPHVTPRAELVGRQDGVTPLAPLIGYSSCYDKCYIAGAQYQSVGNVAADLCNPDGDFVNAYYVAQDCNRDWESRGGGGPSMQFPELEAARSLCTALTERRRFGRHHA